MPESRSKYINNYIKENYDRIELKVPKGGKEQLKEQSKNKGYDSVNEYINYLIKLDRENNQEYQEYLKQQKDK